MPTEIAERLTRITEKVRAHGLRLGPAVTEDILSNFELRCGCALPEGYRAFLKEIGDGAFGPPSYGLLRFAEPPPDMSQEEARPWADSRRLCLPFPFTRHWVWEEADDSDEGAQEQVADGTLHLGTNGCAQYSLLVVTGPERGNVWMLADVGITPTVPKRDFLQWFEDWLDGTRNWWS